MLTQAVLSAVLLLLAAVANAIKDTSALDGFQSEWMNKAESWTNKWESLSGSPPAPWYYLWLKRPKHPEAFPYSSTILVAFTDGWHSAQMVMQSALQLAIAINMDLIGPSFTRLTESLSLVTIGSELLEFAILKVLFSTVFQLLYRYLSKDDS